VRAVYRIRDKYFLKFLIHNILLTKSDTILRGGFFPANNKNNPAKGKIKKNKEATR